MLVTAIFMTWTPEYGISTKFMIPNPRQLCSVQKQPLAKDYSE